MKGSIEMVNVRNEEFGRIVEALVVDALVSRT